MANKKIVGSYQHNVYVSAKTKQEFKKDKEQFKKEGIKSAYSLQKKKNLIARNKRNMNAIIDAMEKEDRRQEVIDAYKLEERKFKARGYTLESFLEDFETIESHNKKIKKAIKKKQLLKDTGLLSFPISKDTGKINIKRLNKILSKTKIKVTEIANNQREVFFTNVKYLYGEEKVNEIRKILENVKTVDIYKYFENDDKFNIIVIYDVDNFTDSNKVTFWDHLKNGYNEFLKDCKFLAKRGEK